MTLVHQRLVKTFIVIVLLFTALVMKLYGIQILQGDQLSHRALQLSTREISLEEFSRGDILDRHGHALHGGASEARLLLFPAYIKDKAVMADRLAGIVPGGVSFDVLLRDDPVMLTIDLAPQQVAAINELNHPGVMVLPVQLRYGSRPLAVHVSGHLSRAPVEANTRKSTGPDQWFGVLGLERFYDEELHGQRSKKYARIYVDARDRLVGGSPEVVTRSVRDNQRHHLVTTIDINIQTVVEDVMDREVPLGSVVVMDARTGDILAAASRPSYNPHPRAIVTALATGSDVFLDQTTALFQPGSIFKLVVAAAAMEEGLASPDTVFQCHGEQGPLISCWHSAGHGSLTLEEAFAVSCNPTFAQLGLKLGAEKLIQYARAFGLDNQTIIGYPVREDTRQDLSLLGAGYNLVNSSVGQGPVLVTPVQMAAMVNVVVNNGVYLPPRLVKEVRNDEQQTVRYLSPGSSTKVISSFTATRLKGMLEATTTRGVGTQAFVPVYGSAGKTGSAQLDESGGTVNAWFAGYAPLSKPRYVIVILVREGVSGGQTAAPVFREITRAILDLP